jgi:tetratricopeptide (TPR) repeat protein
LHRARAAYASGIRADFERDVETLERAFPQRFETLLLRGLARLERGDLEKARDVLERAVRANPSEPLAHLLLAETALRDGHLAAAREEYRRVLILDPHDALAPIGLASVLYSEGSLDEAEAALAEAPLADPHLPEGMRPRFLREAARAGLLLAEGRFVAAKGILSRARNEAYRAGDEESLVDLTIRRFYVFLEQGETDSAGTELSEVRFRGSAPFLRTEKTGAVAALEGLLGAHRRDYGTVIAKRLELETVPASNAAERGVFESLYYIFQGSTWEARLPLRAALRERDCARIRHLLGRASIGSAGQTASAIDDLEWVANRGESLLDLPPVLAVNFYYLGRAFEERGQKPDAEMAYREFLHYRRHADGGSPEVAHATAYARGGETGPPGRR